MKPLRRARAGISHQVVAADVTVASYPSARTVVPLQSRSGRVWAAPRPRRRCARGGHMATDTGIRAKLGEFNPRRHAHRNSYQEVQSRLGFQDRLALAVTGAIGTMYAVYVFAVFMALWMLWQLSAGPNVFAA